MFFNLEYWIAFHANTSGFQSVTFIESSTLWRPSRSKRSLSTSKACTLSALLLEMPSDNYHAMRSYREANVLTYEFLVWCLSWWFGLCCDWFFVFFVLFALLTPPFLKEREGEEEWKTSSLCVLSFFHSVRFLSLSFLSSCPLFLLPPFALLLPAFESWILASREGRLVR